MKLKKKLKRRSLVKETVTTYLDKGTQYNYIDFVFTAPSSGYYQFNIKVRL
jgi:hypothetical protein